MPYTYSIPDAPVAPSMLHRLYLKKLKVAQSA